METIVYDVSLMLVFFSFVSKFGLPYTVFSKEIKSQMY